MPITWTDHGVGHDYGDQRWVADLVADLHRQEVNRGVMQLVWIGLLVLLAVPWWYGLFEILKDIGIL